MPMGYNGLFWEMEVKVCLGSFYRRVKLKIINIIGSNKYNIWINPSP